MLLSNNAMTADGDGNRGRHEFVLELTSKTGSFKFAFQSVGCLGYHLRVQYTSPKSCACHSIAAEDKKGNGRVAEWSKAPCSGRGPKGCGFESLRCGSHAQIFDA